MRKLATFLTQDRINRGYRGDGGSQGSDCSRQSARSGFSKRQARERWASLDVTRRSSATRSVSWNRYEYTRRYETKRSLEIPEPARGRPARKSDNSGQGRSRYSYQHVETSLNVRFSLFFLSSSPVLCPIYINPGYRYINDHDKICLRPDSLAECTAVTRVERVPGYRLYAVYPIILLQANFLFIRFRPFRLYFSRSF